MRDWRPATVAALGDLLGWYARREASQLASAPAVAANDDAAAPPTSPAAEVGKGVASRPRCT